jgi:hypothetical protein
MKKAILFLLFVLPCATVFTQDKDFDKNFKIGAYADAGWNMPVRLTTKYITEETSPWYGYGSWSAGVRFSGMLSVNYRIEIAACYSGHKVGFELSPPIYDEKKIYTENFGTVSIPVTLKRYLQKNFFFSAGTIIDFALENKPVWLDTQSGLGLTIGAGREFHTRLITIDLAPELQLHSVVPFNEDNYHQRLFFAGLSIGFSYNLTYEADSKDKDNVK